jgi:hypothetical protein
MRYASLDKRLELLNPLLRGWSTYYRHAWGAKRVFAQWDRHVWGTIRRWLRAKQAGIGMRRIYTRYGWRKPGGRTWRWRDGGTIPFEMVSRRVQRYRHAWMKTPVKAPRAYSTNRVLHEQLGTKHLRFTDEQRRRLAVKGKVLGMKLLRELGCLVTPDTILRWYRELIAMKYDGSEHRRPGRPNKPEELRELVVRMAQENPGWGYTRIRDALANLGHEIARGTVQAILKDQGIEPERSKRTSWKTFLRSPNLNAYAERFVRSIKRECLSKLVLLGESHLRAAVREYLVHYHQERNHQGLGGRIILPSANHNRPGSIVCRDRLGGLLRFYHRNAA